LSLELPHASEEGKVMIFRNRIQTGSRTITSEAYPCFSTNVLRRLLTIAIVLLTFYMPAVAQFSVPTTGTVTTYFREDINYEAKDQYYDVNNNLQSAPAHKYHHGADIAGGGTIDSTKAVYACGTGKVVYIGNDGATSGYGNFIVIYHGMINNRHVYSFYSHMGNRSTGESFITVRLGQDVVAGTVLGRQGNSGYIISHGTGIHLDWEVRVKEAPFINDSASNTAQGSLIWKQDHRSQTIAASPDYYTGLQLTATDQNKTPSVGATDCQGTQSINSTWHPDGALITDGSTIWLLENSKRRGIPSVGIFNAYGFSFCQAIRVSQQELSCFTPVDANLGAPPANNLLKRSDGAVFLITDRGFKRLFASAAAFEGLGYKWENVKSASDAELSTHPDDPAAPILYSPFSEGTLIKRAGNGAIFVISDGRRRGFSSSYAFQTMGYDLSRVMTLSANVFDPMVENTNTITDLSPSLCVANTGGATDELPPTLSITSHSNGQIVNTAQITLAGTATDAGRGGSGISSVTVNGVRASGDAALGSDTASWSRSITLNQGSNVITVIATDGSQTPNTTQNQITINYQPNTPTPTPSPTPSPSPKPGLPTITGYSWTNTPTGGVPFSGTIYGTNFLVAGTQVWFCQTNTSTCYQHPAAGVNVTSSTSLNVTNVNLSSGSWQIYVVTSAGQSARSAAFTVQSGPPTITGYSWTSIPTAGVPFSGTIYGTNFLVAGTQVWFCQTNTSTCYQHPAAGVNVTTSTSLNVTNVNLSSGSWQIYVVTSGGQSARSSAFNVQLALPTITGYSWTSTPTGGVPFNGTIYGTNFVVGGTQVWFCQTNTSACYQHPAAGVNVTSSTSLNVSNVNLSSGSWQIYVVTSAGQSARSSAFNVQPGPPTIASYSWTSTPTGGVPFSGTIYGTNFVVGGTQVWFCQTNTSTCYQHPAAGVNVTSSTSLNVSNVNLSSGSWQFYVQTAARQSSRSTSFLVR
jgi:murein DD-endopeptidase MepM/ murein hydrolase activator NlpD